MDNDDMHSEKIKYASITPRFAAFVIDLSIIYLGITLLLKLFSSQQISAELEELLVILLNMIYNIVMVATNYRGTLGKILFELAVVDENMQRLSLSHSIGRYFAYYYSYLTLGIGFLMIGLTKKHTGLHDKIAHTYVIYKNK